MRSAPHPPGSESCICLSDANDGPVEKTTYESRRHHDYHKSGFTPVAIGNVGTCNHLSCLTFVVCKSLDYAKNRLVG
jgi:hypothetical protein